MNDENRAIDPQCWIPNDVHFLISATELQSRISEMAKAISVDYAGRQPLFIGVLNGAWVFMAELVRKVSIPICCDFVKVSSYGEATTPSAEITIQLDHTISAEGRDVLIIEDIVDTGASTFWLTNHLKNEGAASVRLCSLLSKPAKRRLPVTIDYLGFTVPDCFVVGFGIDFAQKYRQLPFVGFVGNTEVPALE